MNNDLHQWYMDLERGADQVKVYEDTIVKYYKNLHFPLQRQLTKPFLKGFYKKDHFAKYLKYIIPTKFIYSLGMAIIGFVVGFLYNGFTFEDGIGESFANNLWGMASFGVTIMVILFISSLFVLILFSYLRNKQLIKKMEKLEAELEPILITLPAHYRSYNKMTLIVQTYYAMKGVLPEQAFYACDENIKLMPERLIPSVMFDLGFENNLIRDEKYTAGETKVTTQPEEYRSEFLPSDIKQKTFAGSQNAEDDLQKMVALADVKDQIVKLENKIKFFGSNQTNGNHMAFLGGAGTGKTSIARIITKIMYDLGYIKKNQYVEISGDYLRSGSSDRAWAIVEYSYGGVLFIDEAYLLYDKDGRGNDAVGILLKAMEDHRNDFIVILAGYEEQMTRLIASNEGFSSRIKHTIYFPDYTVEEMYAIFLNFLSNYGGKSYTLSAEAKPLLLEAFELEKRSMSFGNARTVRNAVDTIMDYYVDRSINNQTDVRIIELSDVEKYYADRSKVIQHELKNSSAAKQIDESIIRLNELKSRVKDGSDVPLHDLSEMVGLDSLKNVMQLLKNQKEFYNESKQQKILIVGDCGLSSIVKILTGYMFQLGYIQDNSYLEVSAEMFKGSYVGHTTKRAEAIVSYASGGVLFIRNINRIAEGNDSFDKEVIGVINDALANNENVTIIIGDTNSNYINSLRSQMDITYDIPKYNKEELHTILVKMLEHDGFQIDQTAHAKMDTMISENGGVRSVLNLYNNIKKRHMVSFTEETKYLITEQDIELPKLTLSFGKPV